MLCDEEKTLDGGFVRLTAPADDCARATLQRSSDPDIGVVGRPCAVLFVGVSASYLPLCVKTTHGTIGNKVRRCCRYVNEVKSPVAKGRTCDFGPQASRIRYTQHKVHVDRGSCSKSGEA